MEMFIVSGLRVRVEKIKMDQMSKNNKFIGEMSQFRERVRFSNERMYEIK